MRQSDGWLGLYQPESGELTTLLLEDHLGHIDEIRAIGKTEAEVAVAVTLATSPNHDGDQILTPRTDILVVRFDLQGNELGRTLVSPDLEPDSTRVATQIVADATGQWFIGGVHEPLSVTTLWQTWFAQVHAESSWHWRSEDVADASSFGGIIGLDDGVLAAVSLRDYESKTARSWIGSFSGDGTPRWELVQEPEGDYDGYTHSVLIEEHDGVVRVAGLAWQTDGPSVARSCLIAQ